MEEQMEPPVKKYSQIMHGQQRYTTTFTWKLCDWHLFYDIKYSKGVTSDCFELDGTNGCMCQIFLNPMDPVGHLTLIFSHPKSILKMEVSININKKESNLFNMVNGCNKRHRLIISIPNSMKKEQRSVLVSEPLTIFAKFTIAGFPKVSISRNPPKNILQHIKVLFEEKILCDVNFIIGDEEFPAHKTIVAAQSKVFQAMFLNEMLEKEKGTVNIPDTRAEVFQKFLDYLYTGEVDNFEDIVDELIVIADKYQVSTLKETCTNYMLLNLCETNVVKYLLVADKLCCTELKEKAFDIFQHSANALVEVIEEGDQEVSMSLKKLLIDFHSSSSDEE
ncbi:speckle-type POZ protein-like isoform X2 [Venturia canescens]|uniref:speckle-type POZ protein-like isoform X2 n=1 Tax=Venturia canescens TaxID=32260 RepID=UPI001C9CF415|nr:speckle-type POZ protein-like isoform X2 [Venturia canescens]